MYPKVDIIPVLSDNYCFLVHARDNSALAIVDPGEDKPVHEYLTKHRLQPSEIWVTHHHYDHVGGVEELGRRYGIPVRAPAEVQGLKIRGTQVNDGDRFAFGPSTVEVVQVSGHTRGHVMYFVEDVVFCGDVLFVCGCGRLFEGTAEELYNGIVKHILSQPDNMRFYCGHEYSEKNLRFALELEPENVDIQDYLAYVKALRAERHPSVPAELGRERTTNPFLRSTDPRLVSALRRKGIPRLDSPVEVFAVVRKLRDRF